MVSKLEEPLGECKGAPAKFLAATFNGPFYKRNPPLAPPLSKTEFTI